MKYFAVSDIHGDFEQFLYHMLNYGIIDKNHKWSAKDSRFFILGDGTDRGPNGYEVLSFIKSLQEDAFLVGGEVHYLLGNHDALLLSQVYGIKEMFGYQAYNTQLMFANNGGQERDVNLLSMDLPLLKWLEQCPFILKEGTTLFQHCDATIYYDVLPFEQRLYIPYNELCLHINTALRYYVSKFGCKSDGYFNLFYKNAPKESTILMPAIGSDRAGGDWNLIKSKIEEYSNKYQVKTIVRYIK